MTETRFEQRKIDHALLPPCILMAEYVSIPSPVGEILTCLLTCNSTAFESRLFETEGIAFPNTIKRSVQKRQSEFFFGRLAARLAIAATGLQPSDVPIGLSREPTWPAGMLGSISHSGEYAAAAVTETSSLSGIGIDLEAVVAADTLREVQSLVLSGREKVLVDQYSSKMSVSLLTTLAFSAKESLFKAAYRSVGHFFDFSSASVTALDTSARTLTLHVTEPLSGDFPVGRKCHVSYWLLCPDIVFTSFAW